MYVDSSSTRTAVSLEAYIHGMNGIAEGVRQLRGTSVNPGAGRGARAVPATMMSQSARRRDFRPSCTPQA
jgi:hypothetical protein